MGESYSSIRALEDFIHDVTKYQHMCDASDYAVGTVLGQCRDKQHYAISYASKTLTGPQLNHATTEKELLAAVFTMDKFISYLVSAKVIV